jgi:hypothetical protein
MQPSLSNPVKKNTASIKILSQDWKAALGAAFQLFPVALAFTLSSICILFLVNNHPTSPLKGDSYDLSRDPPKSNSASVSSDQKGGVHTEISSVFTKEVQFWEEEILSWAETYDLDPNLVAVVMQIESCGHPDIQSKSGAKGLFQVMPFHFSSDENPFTPDTNAKRGLSYLSGALSLAQFDTSLALAGYNAGHSVIGWDPSTWPDETRRYVYWGSGILTDIAKGNSRSLRLEEWLEAGGDSLCRSSSNALGL